MTMRTPRSTEPSLTNPESSKVRKPQLALLLVCALLGGACASTLSAATSAGRLLLSNALMNQGQDDIEPVPRIKERLAAAERAASEGDFDRAESLLQPLHSLAPNAERVLLLSARIALARTEPASALLPLQALQRMHPSVAEYSYLLGVARLALSDLQNAEVALRRAIELAPKNHLAWAGLGLSLNGLDRHQEARAVLGEALRLRPESIEARAAMSESLEGSGELDAAEQEATAALTGNPEHAKALLVLGMVRMKQGLFAEAKDFLLRSLESSDTPGKAHYQLSLAYTRLGDRESSSQHYQLYKQSQDAMEERILTLRGQVPGGSSSP